MKRLLPFFITALIVLSGAQQLSAQISCTTVTGANYFQCCSKPTPSANERACSAYIGTLSGQSTGITSAPQTLDGGTIRTDAQWRDYCDGIAKVNNQNDFNDCCNYQHGVGYDASRCYDWYMNGKSSVPGTVNSGTLNTKPSFAEQPLIDGNPAVSPQSGSAVLQACSAIKFKSLLDILVWVKCVITAIVIPLIFTFAFLFFLWNVLRFMRSSADKDKQEAKERMWWGIVALFIMLSIWGIIAILSGTLGITPSVPLLQTKVYLDPANANKGK